MHVRTSTAYPSCSWRCRPPRRAHQSKPQAVNGTPNRPGGLTLPTDYVIGVDDVLSVVFWREKDLSVEAVVVRPDGKISLPMLNDVAAAGMTPEQLAKVMSRRRPNSCAIPA